MARGLYQIIVSTIILILQPDSGWTLTHKVRHGGPMGAADRSWGIGREPDEKKPLQYCTQFIYNFLANRKLCPSDKK